MKQLPNRMSRELCLQPVAVIRENIEQVARRCGFALFEGSDDLDTYKAALLETRGGDVFALVRHRAVPSDLMELHVARDGADARMIVQRILSELGVPADAWEATRDDLRLAANAAG